jgi:hypothetical protein
MVHDYSCLYHIFVCKTYMEQVFSIMNSCWRSEHIKRSINLIKSEIVLKMICKGTCKDLIHLCLRRQMSLKQESQKVLSKSK